MSGSAPAWVGIAQAAREGRIDAALARVSAALEAPAEPPSPAVLTAAGVVRLGLGSFVGAARAAAAAIRIDPGYEPAYPVLGLAYDRLGGMSDQAVLVWSEALELLPRFAPGHVLHGESLLAAGLASEARASWKRAARLRPGCRARWDLALLDLVEEGVPAGLEAMRVASFEDTAETDVFCAAMTGAAGVAPGLVTGARRACADDPLRALAAARRLLDGRPDDPAALSLAGFAMLRFASDSEALATSLRALTVEPGYPPALAVAGSAFSRRPGLAAHAAATLEGLARAMPSSGEAHVLLAEALLGCGRYGDATVASARAVAAAPRSVRPRYVLAFCLILADRHAEAWWHTRRAADHEIARRGLLWDLLEAREGAGAP